MLVIPMDAEFARPDQIGVDGVSHHENLIGLAASDMS
jgi:hypothetical protein